MTFAAPHHDIAVAGAGVQLAAGIFEGDVAAAGVEAHRAGGATRADRAAAGSHVPDLGRWKLKLQVHAAHAVEVVPLLDAEQVAATGDLGCLVVVRVPADAGLHAVGHAELYVALVHLEPYLARSVS